MQIDHLVVAGETLDQAATHIESALGIKMLAGGRHDHFGTHNRVLGLADGLYLEAIAIDPDSETFKWARWFDLDRFVGTPRLTHWVCRTEDFSEEPSLSNGKTVALARGDYRWEMLVPDDGILPFGNLFPALIRWRSFPTPAENLPPSGCALRGLRIEHPEFESLKSQLGFHDSRVEFVFADHPKMQAVFDTADGEKTLF